MRLSRNYAYYNFIFPKIDKRGVGIRAGGLENFSKINKRGGDDYSVLESSLSKLLYNLHANIAKIKTMSEITDRQTPTVSTL